MLWLPTQTSKLYENPPCVSCSFIRTLPCIYHSKKNSWSPPPVKIDGEQEYEVEDILDSRISNHQLQYLVHWHGYDMSKHTWEPIKNYQMPWKRFMCFINNIQTTPSSVLMELVARRGGDVTDVNAMEFTPLNVHPYLALNLYLTFCLILIHS
jgi:hypothetical protein